MAILLAKRLFAHIGSIHRKKGQQLHQSSLQPVERDVRAMAVPAGTTFQQVGEALDVARHVFADNQTLLFNGDLPARRIETRDCSVDLREFFLMLLIAKNAIDVIQKIVAGSALYGPGRRQFLRQIKNLFDDDVNIAELLSKTLQIRERVVKSVDMIDSHAGKFSRASELENQGVTIAKNLFVLDSHGDQLVDVKKTPVVELFGGHFPKRQTIELFREQLVQEIEALGIAFDAIEPGDVGVDELLDFGAAVKFPEHAFDKDDLIGALADFFLGRKIFQNEQNAEQLDEIGMLAAKLPS